MNEQVWVCKCGHKLVMLASAIEVRHSPCPQNSKGQAMVKQ